MNNTKYIGILKWFDKEKGYGVIATNNNFSVLNQNANSNSNPNEVFLHINNWKDIVAIDLTLKVSVILRLILRKIK